MPFKRRFKDTQRAPAGWHGVTSRERRSRPPTHRRRLWTPIEAFGFGDGRLGVANAIRGHPPPFNFGDAPLGVAKW
jgi:hypothetical protein